ncbi:MAG: AAA family ATPase [Lewinellaceae bacterium]|nr:AAA family ATPase [Lewinellaceae bacterium]
MGIQVQKIRIKNFRSLQQVETTLGEVTLLLGANNSGKTSFLRALSIALNGDRMFIARDDLFINGEGKLPSSPQINIDLKIIPKTGQTFTDEWAQVFGDDIQIDAAGSEFFAYRTSIDFSANQPEAKIRRYVIVDWESDGADENQEVRANLVKTPLFFIDAQRDLQEDLKYAQSYFGRLASQIEYDDDQKKKLEEGLGSLNSEAVEKSQVLAHLKTTLEELNKTVATKGKGVEITPFPKKLRDLHKGLKVHFQDGGSETFSLEYHGMGTRSWASLLGYKAFIDWMVEKTAKDGDVLYPVLALEEPEAHLHPNAQRQVYGQLKQMPGQKIISTHSPYIAPLASLSELRLFYKGKDSTEISDLTSFISGITPKEKHNVETSIMRHRGELLFARIVVLFEGFTEEAALPIFACYHWECEAFEKGVALIHCGGGDYKLYLQLLEALHIPWLVFSDYDRPEIKTKLNSAATSVGVSDMDGDSRFICLSSSIEDYLIDEGYRTEIQEAYFSVKEPEYSNIAKRQAERARVEGLSLQEFKEDNRVKSWKAKMAASWAQSIVTHSNENKRLPGKIKLLFETIDQHLK